MNNYLILLQTMINQEVEVEVGPIKNQNQKRKHHNKLYLSHKNQRERKIRKSMIMIK